MSLRLLGYTRLLILKGSTCNPSIQHEPHQAANLGTSSKRFLTNSYNVRTPALAHSSKHVKSSIFDRVKCFSCIPRHNCPPRRTFIRPALQAKDLQISGSSSSATLLEMKKTLRQKSVDFTESHACLIITLPKHIISQSDPLAHKSNISFTRSSFDEVLEHSLTKVYVNKLTSRFICPDESIFGDWSNLRAFILAWHKQKQAKKGESPEPLPPLGHSLDLDKIFYDECSSHWNGATPIEALDTKEFKEILKSFKLSVKEVKIEDFVRFEVRVAREANGVPSLLFPVRYPGSGKLVGLKLVSLDPENGEIFEENLPTEKYLSGLQVAEGKPWIHRIFPLPLGLDRVHKSNPTSVILVTSVLDALALSSHNNVVTLAEGASNLPPEHLPFLEKFAQIIFWFPETVSSADAVQTFSRKLGERRCHTVSREFPQPSLWICKRKAGIEGSPTMSQILRHHLRPCCHEYITTFESLREDVYLEMAHLEEVEGIKWKRFDSLNELIRGFRRGELSIFSGRTGSGKTTFMSEYSLDLCTQGVNTLWGSFEVSNVRLAKMQLKQFSAINLEENLDQFDSWADKFQKLPMYYLTFHGAQEVEKVLEAMSTAVYLYDISHAIIDNIQFMMGTGRNMDRFYTQDLIIQKLREFATLHNVHLTLVIHPRKEDDNERLTTNSIFGGAKATQEADNVILLQEENVNPKVKRKFIQVMKNRFSGDLGSMPLFFNRGTLTFSKKIFLKERHLSSHQKRTKKETDPKRDGFVVEEEFRDDE